MSVSPAIEAQGLGKRYRLGSPREQHDSLRDLIASAVTAPFRRAARTASRSDTFWALQQASFAIAHGENVGVIGLNGAGKSTLLKILSRITAPTNGHARIHGRIGALLEVGTGFHGDLSGRENVFLYGAILGMTQREIAQKFDAIVEFAGLDKFIDTPVKRYSSGMYVRLAFAVAAHLEPEILLLDEVLAVGDVAFQKKCMDFARALQAKDATILFVSHNMFSIKTMCERVIYLKSGRIEFDGPTDRGIELYENDCRLSTLPWVKKPAGEPQIVITDCALLGADGQQRAVFDFGDRMTLRLTYDARKPLREVCVIVAFIRSDGVACCNYSSEADNLTLRNLHGAGVIEVTTPPLSLVAERYDVSILVREKGYQTLLCGQHGASFHIRHELFDTHFGVFHEPAKWLWHQAQESGTEQRRVIANQPTVTP